jgi:hypothetical protein
LGREEAIDNRFDYKFDLSSFSEWDGWLKLDFDFLCLLFLCCFISLKSTIPVVYSENPKSPDWPRTLTVWPKVRRGTGILPETHPATSAMWLRALKRSYTLRMRKYPGGSSKLKEGKRVRF